MSEKIYTGNELEAALNAGQLIPEAPPLRGMIKATEKSGFISFTLSGCESWLDLPTDMIAKAVHLGDQRCGDDHSHPVVEITLKDQKDPTAQILLALLRQAADLLSGDEVPDESADNVGALQFQIGGQGAVFENQGGTIGRPPRRCWRCNVWRCYGSGASRRCFHYTTCCSN